MNYAMMLKSEGELSMAGRADIVAVYQRDPACNTYLQPLLFLRDSKPYKRTELRIGFGRRVKGYGLLSTDALF